MSLWSFVKDIFVADGPEPMATAATLSRNDKGELNIRIVEGDEAFSNEERMRVRSPTMYQYPSNVGTDERQPHSVVFNINVRSNTRAGGIGFAGSTTYGSSASTPFASAQQNERTKQNRLKSGMLPSIMTAAGIGTGLLITGSVAPKAVRAAAAGDASFLGQTVVGFVTGAAVTAVGGAVGFSAASAIENNFETRRLLAAIQLHVSQAPSMSYSATWDNTELGALGAFGAGFSFDDVLTAGTADYLTRKIIGAASIIPRELGMLGDLGGAIESSTKKINNPYKEQLFKSMGFRKFQFSYKFAPRNSAEYASVKEIIKLFKYHMHPEKDTSKLFLQYPSEFDIVYKYKESNNENISKISTCALSDMGVTYGGSDGFNTVIGTRGAPSEINITLTFTELEVLTNDRIADGF